MTGLNNEFIDKVQAILDAARTDRIRWVVKQSGRASVSIPDRYYDDGQELKAQDDREAREEMNERHPGCLVLITWMHESIETGFMRIVYSAMAQALGIEQH